MLGGQKQHGIVTVFGWVTLMGWLWSVFVWARLQPFEMALGNCSEGRKRKELEQGGGIAQGLHLRQDKGFSYT